jgi:hypothetical protein
MERLSLHFQELQPDSFGTLEEAHVPAIGQHAFFENFYSRGLDFRNFRIEILRVDRDVFKAIELPELLLLQEICDVELDPMEINSETFASVGIGSLAAYCRAAELHVKVHGFLWIRRLEVQVIDSETHGFLLFAQSLWNASRIM